MATRTRKIAILHTLLRAGDLRRLRPALERLDDVRIASELDNLGTTAQVQVLRQLAPERRAAVLASMRYEVAAQLVAHLAPDEAAHLLEDLDVDDAVDILGRIDPDQLLAILSRLDHEDAVELEQLLKYDKNTAGGLMSPEALRLHPDETVEHALDLLRQTDDLPDDAFYVYVVDDDGRLLGYCTLRALVVGDPDAPIADIMHSDVVSVRYDTDQEEVADIVSRYDLVAIPVVDERQRLLGVIAVDDVVDVLREEATEDILKMAGAGEQLVESRSFAASFRARWRWLLAAAMGGLVAAVCLASFEHAVQAVPALAFFMPVVAGMGGNVGTQSSTIVVRGLAVGFVETERVRRLVVREVLLGVTLGAVYGLLTAAVVVLIGFHDVDPWRLAAVIMLGMTASTTLAAAVGTSVPLMFDRFGVDPAVATGPFVTTAVDVIGLLLYFYFASVLLGIAW